MTYRMSTRGLSVKGEHPEDRDGGMSAAVNRKATNRRRSEVENCQIELSQISGRSHHY